MQIKPAFILLFFTQQLFAQPGNELPDSSKQQYLVALKQTSKEFSRYFYPNYAAIYALPEKAFIAKIDSGRQVFKAVLNKYKTGFTPAYTSMQETEIKYYFDKLLVEYPLSHAVHTGRPLKAASAALSKKLKSNLADFNKPELLNNADFTNYVRVFLAYETSLELTKKSYRNSINQYLSATWKLIPAFITSPACREFWQNDYLYNHIENNGIKGIENIYSDFRSTCTDTSYIRKINALYSEDSTGRQDHLIKTYKRIGTDGLDMHMFLPDSFMNGTKRPTIVYFHGGSWSEAKPDWFFEACKNLAKKGWVACAAEYRTHSRHGTLPFDAVMDAKSAIRWLRQHAAEFNIDDSRIVASGNSAGGHLVLCTALVDGWNHQSDDLIFSAVPNVLLVNAGVYDLTDQATAWIRKDLKDKNMIKQISPVFLAKKDFPPALLIHGTNDRNVPYTSATLFVAEMKKAGNSNIQFKTLQGAGHYTWYDPKYSAELSEIRNSFLTSLGYDRNN